MASNSKYPSCFWSETYRCACGIGNVDHVVVRGDTKFGRLPFPEDVAALTRKYVQQAVLRYVSELLKRCTKDGAFFLGTSGRPAKTPSAYCLPHPDQADHRA